MGECYTDIYHHYLKHLREEKFNFLEIGVREGRSIKMWSEYFPNATIVGIDIDPLCSQYSGGNIEIHIGSQDDPCFLNDIINKYQKFRVILDDGSHINSLTMESFKFLNKFATELYIIEDLRHSYEDLTKDVQFWPGMQYNRDLQPNNAATRGQMTKRFFELIQTMDYRMGDWTGISFHAQMVILQKGRISES
jgi:hypothetical protein